jgi:hypothetical protein
MSNLNTHFKLIIEVPEFKKRMGNVKQGKKQVTMSVKSEKLEKVISSKKEKSKLA